MAKTLGVQEGRLTLTRIRDDAQDAPETYELTKLVWPVWKYEIVEVRAEELERLVNRAWLASGGFPLRRLKRPPGPLFMPVGLWERETMPLKKTYLPFQEVRHLLTGALRVDTKQPEELRRFVSTWGLLGLGTVERSIFPFDEVALVRSFLADVQGMAGCLQAIQHENWEIADRYFPAFKDTKTSRSAHYWGAWRHRLNLYLKGAVPGRGEGVHLALELEPTRHWAVRAGTLADVIWAALLFRATKAEPIHQCLNCGHLFVGQLSQGFCPPDPKQGETRSRCLNAWTVRNWRRRNAAKMRGPKEQKRRARLSLKGRAPR